MVSQLKLNSIYLQKHSCSHNYNGIELWQCLFFFLFSVCTSSAWSSTVVQSAMLFGAYRNEDTLIFIWFNERWTDFPKISFKGRQGLFDIKTNGVLYPLLMWATIHFPIATNSSHWGCKNLLFLISRNSYIICSFP